MPNQKEPEKMKKLLQFLGIIKPKEKSREEGVADLFESARKAGDPDPHFTCIYCHKRIGMGGRCACRKEDDKD